jgi:outer membrane lipoprotein carrier protein
MRAPQSGRATLRGGSATSGSGMATRFGAAVVTAVVLVVAATQAQTPASPDEVARALQKRYEGIRDFSADFVQTYRGGVLKTETREQGAVSIKKPGMMRWVYAKPERKEFVSDGRKMYSYIPEDRQVMVADVPPDDQATTPALFLAGKGQIVRDFTTGFEPNPPAGVVALKLTPKKPEPEYDSFVIMVDPKSLQLRGLSTRDRQGGLSVLTFTNLKENTGISDKEFAFRVPRGVDVITNGTRK